MMYSPCHSLLLTHFPFTLERRKIETFYDSVSKSETCWISQSFLRSIFLEKFLFNFPPPTSFLVLGFSWDSVVWSWKVRKDLPKLSAGPGRPRTVMGRARLFPLAFLVVGLFVSKDHTSHGYPVEGTHWNQSNWDENDLSHGNRTIRDVSCLTDDYYRVKSDLCCRQCPAGTRVAQHCRKNHERSKCVSCVQGEDFTKWDNGLEKCLGCSVCREDQQQVIPCTTHSDTVCQCRTWTFCAPDQTCEVCRKCKTHCPDGQIMKSCTPTSDTVCGKPKTETDSTQMGGGTLAVMIVIFCFILALSAIMYYVWKKPLKVWQSGIFRKIGCLHQRYSADSENDTMCGASSALAKENHSGEGVREGMTLDTSNNKMDPDNERAPTERATLLQNSLEASAEYRARPFVRDRCHGEMVAGLPIDIGDDTLGQSGLTHPDGHICAFNTDPPCNCGTVGNETIGVGSTESSTWNTFRASSSVPSKDTITGKHHCTDKESINIEDLRQSFVLFIEEVPFKKWKQFVRKLSLTENEIEAAKQNDNNNAEEAHYQMLNTWLQKTGKAASIDVLLSTLKKMDLNEAADNIKQKIKLRRNKEY